MSHNIHCIIVNAEDPQDAIDNALMEIEEWGTEDNWRTGVCAIDENGKITPNKDGLESNHYAPDEYTLEDLNKIFTEMLYKPNWGWIGIDEKKTEMFNLMKSIIDTDFDPHKLNEFLSSVNPSLMYSFKEFAHALYHISETLSQMTGGRKAFNVFEDNYRSFEFDCVGVTHYDTENSTEPKYCVIIDMHS
jgi:hypothetical protein